MRGFTLVETVVVIFVIAVLLSVLLPAISSARRSAKSVKCLSNLHQIAVGMQQYATDNNGVLPDVVSSQTNWETSLENYVGTAVFECPSDNEIYSVVGSSYDWRDTGDPKSTLAGHTTQGISSDVVLVFDTMPNWHKKKTINVAKIDGSTETMDDQQCLINLLRTLRQ